jgi:hypothetical protein
MTMSTIESWQLSHLQCDTLVVVTIAYSNLSCNSVVLTRLCNMYQLRSDAANNCAEFLREVAEHAAQCKGGSETQIARRRPRILAGIRSSMSVALS